MEADVYSVSDAVSYSTKGENSDTRLITIWDQVSGEKYSYQQREMLEVEQVIKPDEEVPPEDEADWVGLEDERWVDLKIRNKVAILSWAE